MIAHLVTLSFADHVTDGDIARLAESLDRFASEIPALLEYHHGAALGLRPGGADYGILAVVQDEAGLAAYLDHPAHVGYVTTVLAPLLGERRALQMPWQA